VPRPARPSKNTPLGPGGGLVVTARDSERFAADTRNATVVDLDSDHYTVLTDPVAIETIERFLRGKVLGAR
jgi:hypothetical protein